MAYLNAENIAQNIISEHLNGNTIDTIGDCTDNVHQEADTACIYTSHCLDYISQLESTYDAEDLGGHYSAEDWQQAMTAYAFSLVYAAISDKLSEAIESAQEQWELFTDKCDELEQYDYDGIELSTDCQYGWESHDYETSDGVMVWTKLEGELTAVSHQIVPGLWANIAWTPEEEEEDEDE